MLSKKNVSKLLVSALLSLFALPAFAPDKGFILRSGEMEDLVIKVDPGDSQLWRMANGKIIEIPHPCYVLETRPVTMYYNPLQDHNGAFQFFPEQVATIGDKTQPVFIYGAHGSKPSLLAPRGQMLGTGSAWNLNWNSVEDAGYQAGKQYLEWAARNNIPVGRAPLAVSSCYSYENAPLFTRGVNKALQEAGHDMTMIPHVTSMPNHEAYSYPLKPANVNPNMKRLMDKYYGCPSETYRKIYSDSYGPDPVMRSTTNSRMYGNAAASVVLLMYLDLQVGHASQAIRQARENDRTAQQKSMMYDRPGVKVTDEVDAWRNDPMNPSRHFYGANPEHAMERNQRYYAHDGEGTWLKKRPGCKWWQY